ncbi:MAG: biotin transporter BioY [Lachnospiraceae bacterium]|nr:biotin transporter BioY [Lachnospiraceae bacterium]
MESSIKSNQTVNTNKKTSTIALIGVMAAVTCILGPMSIPLPISPVPISLTNFVIYMAIYVLGMKKGTISYLIYLLIGFIGIPVFSAFTSGPAKLLGPTGGYLIGFVFMALICGFFIDQWCSKMYMCFIGMVIGTAVCYLFGTVWLAYQAGMSFGAALAAGVIPFLPGDLAKIVIAMIIGPQIRRRLASAGLN